MPKETPGLTFPLDFTSKNSGYELSDIKDSVKFNIKNIILTNPGERIMIPNFGVGIKQALFENITIELLELVRNRVIEQIKIYAPYIDILELLVRPSGEQSIHLKLKYEIDFVEIVDFIEIEVTNI
tara:strand:- start:2359 stop:2736 length:378 start_codon:yes stop_codon:yes gene_type:complete